MKVRPGAEVLTQRYERGTITRVYTFQGRTYVNVLLPDGAVLDTPAASLRPATRSLLDGLRWWFRWGHFAWRPR